MDSQELPIFILLFIALCGIASPSWGKLHRAMAIVTIFIIGITQYFFKSSDISLNFMAYDGAILSAMAGIYIGYVGWFTDICPDKITKKQRFIISISLVLLILTFIFEAIVGTFGQYLYNHINSKHYFLLELFTPFMIGSTILQSMILLTGGIDGLKRINSFINIWIMHSIRDIYSRITFAKNDE